MNKQLCIYGEVIFDVFPDGHQVLGGAPFNVAWHLQAFDQAPFFISRVGNDAEGMHIRKTMLNWGMDTRALQTDDSLSTGRVQIQLDDGEPSYNIIEPCAYDNINNTSELDGCSLLYHGSLALRNHQSKKALQQLLLSRPSLVFVDVNLRSPWWEKETVLETLKHAHWVKLNTGELDFLYPSSKGTKERLSSFMNEYLLQGIVLTHGDKGAEILTMNNEHYTVEPTKITEIQDTVGAGDAFSSIVIMGLKNNWLLSDTLERAQQFASAIVQNRGSIVNDKSFYIDFMKTWQNA